MFCANIFCLLSPGLPLIGSILRVLQYHSECKDDSMSKDDTQDEQLQTLAEITAEFLADICIQIPKVKPKKCFPVGSDCLLRFLNAAFCNYYENFFFSLLKTT